MSTVNNTRTPLCFCAQRQQPSRVPTTTTVRVAQPPPRALSQQSTNVTSLSSSSSLVGRVTPLPVGTSIVHPQPSSNLTVGAWMYTRGRAGSNI